MYNIQHIRDSVSLIAQRAPLAPTTGVSSARSDGYEEQTKRNNKGVPGRLQSPSSPRRGARMSSPATPPTRRRGGDQPTVSGGSCCGPRDAGATEKEGRGAEAPALAAAENMQHSHKPRHSSACRARARSNVFGDASCHYRRCRTHRRSERNTELSH